MTSETAGRVHPILLLCPDCLMRESEIRLGDLADISLSDEVTCPSCGEVYSVIAGIPILVPEEYRGLANIPAEATDREHLEYENEATKRVARLLSDNRRSLSLDAGCGKGTHSDYFGENLVLLDANFYFVSEAVRRYGGEGSCFGVVADVRCLPFSTGTFELVFSSNVLEHLPPADVAGAIDGMKRATCETLQVDVPNEHGLVKLMKSMMARARIYSRGDYQDESLRHQTEFSAGALSRLGFDVSGCIGWVTRKRLRLGPLWDLYDGVVSRIPSLAETLIGTWREPGGDPNPLDN